MENYIDLKRAYLSLIFQNTINGQLIDGKRMKKKIQNQSYDRIIDIISEIDNQRYYFVNLPARWKNSPSILEIKSTLQLY